MQDGAVTDGDQLAYGRWITGIEVDYSVVLNVRARPDDDTVDVATQHGTVPNARFFCKSDVAHYRCAGNDPSTRMNRRTFS